MGSLEVRFINPKTRLRVAGIGVISNSNLSVEMAQRLLKMNGKYAQLITFDDGKKTGKTGGSKSVKKSEGDSKGGEKGD